MEKFYEQFLTKDYGILPKITDGVFWGLLGIAMFFLLNLYLVFSFVFFFLTFLLEFITRKIFVEYEYEYFDRELTVSKIINKKKRKKIITLNIDNINKVYKPEQLQNYNNVTYAFLKNNSQENENNKNLILFINKKNIEKGYYLSIDDTLFNILKNEKPILFNI